MPGKIGPCLANNLTSYLQHLLTLASQQIMPTSVTCRSKIWNLLEFLKFVFNFRHSGCVLKPGELYCSTSYTVEIITEIKSHN